MGCHYGNVGGCPVLLGGALMCSIAANDIVYALQDREFDERHKLFSIPVVFGFEYSIALAKGLHCFTVILLFSLGWYLKLNAIFYLGVAIIAGAFFTYYRILKKEGFKNIELAFSRCNILVAMSLFVFSSGALLWNIMF